MFIYILAGGPALRDTPASVSRVGVLSVLGQSLERYRSLQEISMDWIGIYSALKSPGISHVISLGKSQPTFYYLNITYYIIRRCTNKCKKIILILTKGQI